MIDEKSQFFAILTNVGMAKQANADALGIPWHITDMGVGDANGTDPIPNAEQTRLINEWRHRPLNQLKIDPVNPAVIIAEQVIPADEGGKWIREIGLYDADGDLVAVANCAPSFKPVLSQGSGRTQIVRMNLIVSNTGSITLKIDPAVVLATRAYVDAAILEVLPKNKTPGEFTRVKVNERGIVVSGDYPGTLEDYRINIASQAEAEAQTGQDNTKPMSALRVFQAIAKRVTQATEAAFGWAKVATQAQTDAGTDDTRMITPKKLRWGFQILKAQQGYVVFPTWLGAFVLQWGFASIPAAATIVPFTLSYPNACFTVVPMIINASAAADVVELVAGPSKNAFLPVIVSSGAAGSPSQVAGSFLWLSLGH